MPMNAGYADIGDIGNVSMGMAMEEFQGSCSVNRLIRRSTIKCKKVSISTWIIH